MVTMKEGEKVNRTENRMKISVTAMGWMLSIVSKGNYGGTKTYQG
jgi:hypothetical protein